MSGPRETVAQALLRIHPVLCRVLERAPTYDELARAIGCTMEAVRQARSRLFRGGHVLAISFQPAGRRMGAQDPPEEIRHVAA